MSGGRVAGTGIERVSRSVAFTFDGERHVGLEGESLAAALCASGRLTLGTGRPARRVRCSAGWAFARNVLSRSTENLASAPV